MISADETPIRVGPGQKTRKKYLLVACTNLLTYYFLGDRSMKTFNALAARIFRGSAQARELDDRIEGFGREAVSAGLHTLSGGPS